MKNPSNAFALLVGLLASASSAIAGPTATMAAAESCGPTFLDIYNFQVGDVFQGEQSSMSGGNTVSNSQIEEKYKIVSRQAIPGGYRYDIEGLMRSTTTSSSQFGPSETHTGHGGFSEVWDYTDSTARKELNACKDQVVRFPDVGAPYVASGPINSGLPTTRNFTRVRIAVGDTASFPLTEDTTRLKILGAPIGGSLPGNLRQDSALKTASSDRVWAVYAAGLGLVRLTEILFEIQIDFRLLGYSRGGDTVGTIYPDAVFIGPDAVRMDPRREGRHSPMLRFTEAGPVLVQPGAGNYRDFTGRRAIALPAAESARLNP